MLNKKRSILIGLPVLLAVACLLELQLHPTSSSTPPVVSNASGGGAGTATLSSMRPANAAAKASLPSHSPASQQSVLAGGLGATNAKPAGPLKPPPAPGVPSEVLDAATTGLPFFLEKIPPSAQQLYGFASTDEMSAAQLGTPLQMHTLTPAALQKSSSSSTVSSLLSDTTMWFFPVLLQRQSKAMLVVDQEGGTWKAVSLGYAGLGHELNQLLAEWPESKGFHPQLVAVFQAKQFYFTVREVDDFNLTPLRLPTGQPSSAMPAFAAQSQPQTYRSLSVLSKTLDELKPVVLRAEIHPNR